MMEQPSLRVVEPADMPFLEAVYASTRAEELAQTDWSAEQKAAFCRQQFLAQDAHYRQHYPTAEFSVIEVGGERVGRLYVARWEKEIRIMDIAVLPEFRRKGMGTKFLRELQEEAKAAGKALSIHVEKFNRALGLYERLGFTRKEDREVYWLLEWRGEGDL
jgi:ribosomal protein S18 acetylase RimI-like enzyme